MNKTILQRFLNDARTMLELGKYHLVLASVRPGLEYTIKSLCKESFLDYDSVEKNLEAMISSLKEAGVVSHDLADLMHKTRRCANVGVHVELTDDGIEEVSREEALEAFDNYKQLCSLMTDTDYSSVIAAAQDTNNVPMKYPDYFDTKRRYSGMWADCFAREALMVKPEYVTLYTKATEEEDVEAMLNIAIGFLSRKTTWNEGLARFTKRKDSKTVERIDFRYYYWTLRAVYYTAKHYTEGKYIPKKYIATAIWDAYTYLLATVRDELYGFYCCRIMRGNIYCYREPNPEDMNTLHLQHNVSALKMFRPDAFDLAGFYKTLPDVTRELEPFLETVFTGEPVIVPVHPDANTDTLEKLKKGNEYLQNVMNMETAKATADLAYEKYRLRKEMQELAEKEQKAREAEWKAEQERKRAEFNRKSQRHKELIAQNRELKEERARLNNDGFFAFSKHKVRLREIEEQLSLNEEELEELNKDLLAKI